MELWEAWQPVFRLAHPDPWHMVHVPSLLAYLSPGDLDCNNSKVWTRSASLSNEEGMSSAASQTPPWIMEYLHMVTMLGYNWAKTSVCYSTLVLVTYTNWRENTKCLEDTCTRRTHKVLISFIIKDVHVKIGNTANSSAANLQSCIFAIFCFLLYEIKKKMGQKCAEKDFQFGI